MSVALEALNRLRQRKSAAATAITQPELGAIRKIAEINATKRSDVDKYAEIGRIVGLPILLPMTDEELEEFNRQNVLASALRDGWRFIPEQAEGLYTYQQYSGLFGPIGVGRGKTLITLMISNYGYTVKGFKKILLMPPSHVLSQLIDVDVPWARTKVPMNFPLHVLSGGLGSKARATICRSNRRGVYVMPHSLLSTKDTYDLLRWIDPDLIVVDECHNFSKRDSARTGRLMTFIEERQSEGAALSGTITKKSIRDYRHLTAWTLRKAGTNPLPNSASLADQWAEAIDTEALENGESNEESRATGPLRPLVTWATNNFPEYQFNETIAGFRRAFQIRLRTAPGVVCSGDAEIGTSLTLRNLPVHEYEKSPGWPELKHFIDQIETCWLTPNGDEIEHAIHTWKWLYELCTGFYNELVWPVPPALAARRRISEQQASEMLDKARVHHGAGQFFSKTLRDWLSNHNMPHLDTPLLVTNDMARHGSKHVSNDLYDAWKIWHSLDFESRPERDRHAIRVCPFKINSAVEWARSIKKGALLWVYNIEVGKWLTDELAKADIDVLHCPAGEVANRAITNPENKDKKVVASMRAHGTGKNLQHFEEQFFVQWPRQPDVAEQTIGRTHRTGQKADELIVHTNTTLEFDALNQAACINDALYIHQSTGTRQKIIICNYDPLPRIFPSPVLRERGAEVRMLSREYASILKQRFRA